MAQSIVINRKLKKIPHGRHVMMLYTTK